MKIIIVILSILLTPAIATGAMDTMCYSNCVQRNLGGGPYCLQACSYDTSPVRTYPTQVAPTVDFSAPIRSFMEGRELRRQIDRQEQYDQVEQQRRQRSKDELEREIDFQRIEAEAINAINTVSLETLLRMKAEIEKNQSASTDKYLSKITSLLDQKIREKEAERHRIFEYFETHVKPKVIVVHPDFDIIMKQKAYWQWAEEQRPALKFATMDSGDPEDIIWAISEYKDWFSKRTGIQGPIIFQPTPEDLPLKHSDSREVQQKTGRFVFEEDNAVKPSGFVLDEMKVGQTPTTPQEAAQEPTGAIPRDAQPQKHGDIFDRQSSEENKKASETPRFILDP